MEPLRVRACWRGRARARVALAAGASRFAAGTCPALPARVFRRPSASSICIARALALNPKVVIADEAGISAGCFHPRADYNLMLDLQREMGIAFLFISHDMAVVERISHRVR